MATQLFSSATNILAAAGAASDNPLEAFGIDPAAILAQLIIFIILIFLLMKFAFKPILAMLQARRETIENSERNAAMIEEKLAKTEQRIKEMLKESNQKAEKLINEAKDSADVAGQKRRKEAISEAERIIEQARDASQREKESAMRELKGEFGRLVAAATSKVASKTLTSEDHKRINEEAKSQISL